MFLHSTNSSGTPLTKPTMSSRRRYRLPRTHSSRTHRKWLFSGSSKSSTRRRRRVGLPLSSRQVTCTPSRTRSYLSRFAATMVRDAATAVICRTASSYAAPGQARIERHQPLPQRALQHDVPVRRAAEQAVGPEILVVVGVDRRPAELLLQVVRRGLLNEGVLGVGSGGHRSGACASGRDGNRTRSTYSSGNIFEFQNASITSGGVSSKSGAIRIWPSSPPSLRLVFRSRYGTSRRYGSPAPGDHDVLALPGRLPSRGRAAISPRACPPSPTRPPVVGHRRLKRDAAAPALSKGETTHVVPSTSTAG